MIYIHLLPFIGAIGNVLFTRLKYIHSHYTYLLYFGPVYLVINYIGTMERGYPLYVFMPWNDGFKTPLIGLTIFVVGVVAYFGFGALLNALRFGNEDNSDDNYQRVKENSAKKSKRS